jgi:hypothetical protein
MKRLLWIALIALTLSGCVVVPYGGYYGGYDGGYYPHRPYPRYGYYYRGW